MQAQVDRALGRSRAAEPLDAADVLALLACPDDDLAFVLTRARELRDEGLGLRGLDGIVTYSRKVFIPLTHLCRYRCSYCTFVTPRATPGAEYLTPDEVVEIARRGREWGCTEALFTLGEAPELRHPEAGDWLQARGFASTVDYLVHCAEIVVRETGLLPHANPGAVGEDEMRRLRDVSASQGLMMEQLTDRLLRPGEAHAGAAGKAAAARLEQLDFAARTRTPFTTGMLIGIGETLGERASTILAVRDRDQGQIQEFIVQNFRAKPDTPMRDADDATEAEMLRAIAATRLAFGPLASIQAPPNLTPGRFGRYLDAGVNDWGGVSPLTPDHVNPEMPWPRLDELDRRTREHGFTLRQRLPVYPEYLRPESFEGWVAAPMRRHVLAAADGMGLAREDRWHAGEGWVPVHRAAQPVPRRRALALAMNKPEMRAEEVSAQYGESAGAGCGDASGRGVWGASATAGSGSPPGREGTVGFDEMLADVPSRTALRHERADLLGTDEPSHPWLRPLVQAPGRPGPALLDLIDKARQGERLDQPEAERLFRAEGADLAAVVRAADALRLQVAGDVVTYVINRNVTYTNFCHTGCGFCGFARPLGHEDGYSFSPEEIGHKTREAWDLGATEVCIQGGIHPRNDGRIYLEIAQAVKAAVPRIHLHGFSPLEVTVGASTLGLDLEAFIPMLAEAGLDTMPGTAAEILDTEVRVKLTPEKLTADDWLRVMRIAHANGIRSTSTIMFGHVDHPRAWAQHLLRLRDLQAQTGGFTEIVPLPFVHHRSPIFMRGASRTGPTWREAVKIHAVARLVLHPLIPNVQASWVKLGVEGVVAMLEAGCNDFGGTLMEEHISRMAGASHGLGLPATRIQEAIRGAGRVPRQRSTTYGSPPRRDPAPAGV